MVHQVGVKSSQVDALARICIFIYLQVVGVFVFCVPVVIFLCYTFVFTYFWPFYEFWIMANIAIFSVVRIDIHYYHSFWAISTVEPFRAQPYIGKPSPITYKHNVTLYKSVLYSFWFLSDLFTGQGERICYKPTLLEVFYWFKSL